MTRRGAGYFPLHKQGGNNLRLNPSPGAGKGHRRALQISPFCLNSRKAGGRQLRYADRKGVKSVYVKHKSIVRQATERLRSMAAWGQSKHTDKAKNGGKPASDKIYSYSTMDNYKTVAVHFAKWARANHGCRDIDQARPYTGEYLQGRMDAGKSAWTVRRDAAALGKLYQCHTTELGVNLPGRHRADIKQHRTGASKGHFSEARNRDLVDLCRSTGLRRHEVAQLRPDDVTQTPDGRTLVHVRQGKGGKARTVQALDSTPARLAEQASLAGRSTVIGHIPKYAPIHEYWAQFAQAMYSQIAKDLRDLPFSEKYHCRGDRRGTCYDKKAMAAVSAALGHNVNADLKLSFFAETKCHFSAVGIIVYTALFNNFTRRHEACQDLIYQPGLGLTGENGKYNYSKAVHVYPPFSDITCSAKNYKIARAMTGACGAVETFI